MASKDHLNKLAEALKGVDLGGLEYLDHMRKTIMAGLGLPTHDTVDLEGLETRVAEHILGIDYGRDDQTAYQVLAAVPRERVKEIVYATLYGGTVGPNKNGDVFSPEATQRALEEMKKVKPWVVKPWRRYQEFSMGCSVPKDPPADMPFMSHEALRNMRQQQVGREDYMKEYMGQWPKEEDMPISEAIGREEVKKHKKVDPSREAEKNYMAEMQQKAQQRRESVDRCHSEATQRFIDAQRSSKPKKLVEKSIQQNEEALAAKELKKVTEGVNWKPGHCRICGHANGCHHPRVQTPQGTEELYEKACTHLFLTRISGPIATELGVTETEQMTKGVYACRECQRVILIPLTHLSGTTCRNVVK